MTHGNPKSKPRNWNLDHIALKRNETRLLLYSITSKEIKIHMLHAIFYLEVEYSNNFSNPDRIFVSLVVKWCAEVDGTRL